MTSCKDVKGINIIRVRDPIRSMNTRGDIMTGGVTIYPMMSKGEKEKDQKHEDMGRNPEERYTFPLMSNGERNIIRDR
jgi:hypothetical protein